MVNMKTSRTRWTFKGKKAAIERTFRSGLEAGLSADLEARNVQFEYESEKIKYTVPSREATYTPDFKLSNGIYVEAKGIFDVDDRHKHLLVKQQHPNLDIRFVFQNSKAKIYKGSKTSYADWCRKHGYQYADKKIPDEWLRSL